VFPPAILLASSLIEDTRLRLESAATKKDGLIFAGIQKGWGRIFSHVNCHNSGSLVEVHVNICSFKPVRFCGERTHFVNGSINARHFDIKLDKAFYVSNQMKPRR
jgi:hypothetical protein